VFFNHRENYNNKKFYSMAERTLSLQQNGLNLQQKINISKSVGPVQ